MLDKYQRNIEYMRLSITDSCNFRCKYCIPNDAKLSHNRLSIENIELIATELKKLGINKIKLTGGEPLLHPDIIEIVDLLKNKCEIDQVTLTTNGALLHKYITDFERLGLDGITISIDTIIKDDFNNLVQRDQYDQVIENIKSANNSKIESIKLNCVPLRAMGNQNIINICKFAHQENIPIRFIEVMPIGYGKKYPGYDNASLLEILSQNFGEYSTCTRKLGNGPAEYYTFNQLSNPIGVISAVSKKFCETCNKIRVTSTGHLKQCLHYNYNLNLVSILQQDDGLDKVKEFIIDKPKEHSFNDLNKDKNKIETLNMSEIGG